MSGWSTPDPVMPVDGGIVDWINEKRQRANRFGLAYHRALIDNVVLHKPNDHDGVGPLLDMPARELAELLRGLNITLPLRLHPWSSFEVIADRGLEAVNAPGDEFYVPSGHRLLETVFTEFVSGRYIAQLFCHLDAYAELYTFGVRRSDPEEIAWRISDTARQSWSEHLQRCYSRLPWRKEPWVDHELSSTGLKRLQGYDSERRLLESSRREEFVRLVVGEDRDWPIAAKTLQPCAELLADGPLGYWEKHRVPLSSEFRAAFIDGSRVGYVIGDDGSLAEIGRDWWQGGECTRLLHALNFARPDGVLLERMQSPSAEGSLDERVSGALAGLAQEAPPPSGYEIEVQQIYQRLVAMVEDGTIPRERQTREKLGDAYRRMHGDAGVNKLKDAVGRLVRAYPVLNKGPGAPSKG